jgi:hypothetical protein
VILERLAVALTPVYRTYHRTLRVRVARPDGSELPPESVDVRGRVFGLSECDAFALGGLLAGRGFVVLVAEGRDGDWASALLLRLGCTVVRGSSRHSPERALRQLLASAATSDSPMAIVVDGPRGPMGVVKPGVVYVASMARRPLVLLAATASWRLTVPRTWSRLYVPLPWSHVVVALDHEARLPASEAEPKEVAEQLSRRLAALRERAYSSRLGPCARIGPLASCDRVSIETRRTIDRARPLSKQSTEQGMGADLWSRVHAILADFVGPSVGPGSITRTSRLREDLGLSSLRTIDLVIRFEDAFETSIPEEDLANLRTVGDLMQALDRHLAKTETVEPG